ncbi:Lrp/AsnC ligand binding domain-containing protein [Streptomyces sp. NPDC058257]|uniref:Lrp/AsnC ligand binding domain-containing protein n=1 Tax=Streptomyces sp. NPDC058257 TaxID=3346409 RepID=UPI0036ED80E3
MLFRGTARSHSRIPGLRTVERFERTLAEADEVVELRRLFGSPDRVVRVAVAVADLAVYETFPSEPVTTIPRVENATSHFPMNNVKPAPWTGCP